MKHSILTLLIGVLSFSAHLMAQLSVSPIALTFQEGAPVSLIGSVSANGDLFNSVTVVNTSNKTIVRLQLAWVALDAAQKTVVSSPVIAPASDVNLKPWESAEVGRQGASVSDAMALSKRWGKPVEVDLGIVYVRFADGSSWSYPVTERNGRFIAKYDPQLLQKLSPAIEWARQQPRPAAAQE